MVSRRSLKRRQAHDVSIHDGAVIYSSAEHSLKKKQTNKKPSVSIRSGRPGADCVAAVCVSAHQKSYHLHVHCSTRRSWDTEDYLPRCHPVLFVIASSCCCCFVFFRLQQEINMSRPLPGATKPKAKHVRTISRDYQRGV